MTNPLCEQFERDGFLVVEDVANPEECAQLLNFTIYALSISPWNYVRESEFRTHCPLPMSRLVKALMHSVVERTYPVWESALSRRRGLVELSSIIVFPHAQAQAVHRDEAEAGKHVVTAFVNLLPTARHVGALSVFPGSHRTSGTAVPAGGEQVLELPAGAAVLMNGKLQHYGTENTSVDRIRPVIYFSFGDDDVNGPIYSIRPEYRGKFDLSSFHTSP